MQSHSALFIAKRPGRSPGNKVEARRLIPPPNLVVSAPADWITSGESVACTHPEPSYTCAANENCDDSKQDDDCLGFNGFTAGCRKVKPLNLQKLGEIEVAGVAKCQTHRA